MEVRNMLVSFDEENGLRFYDNNGNVIAFLKSGEVNTSLNHYIKLGEQIDKLRAENEKLKKENEELKIADRVRIGEFGFGEDRVRRLTEAGYDYNKVQEIVNERVNLDLPCFKGLLNKITELEKANKVMQDRLMEDGYCAQCEWMEGEMADMEQRLDKANAKIAKLEHKIERKDKYIEKIRHENDLLGFKCRLRESDLKCLEKMYFELDDDRHVMHKALGIAVKHINAVNYSPFDTRPAITIDDYILKAKEELKND